MRIYKDEATQLKFEEFVDRMITGNEVVLIEECMDKFNNNPELTAEELEQSFLSQCTVYFELIASLNKVTEEIKTAASDSLLH